MVLQICIDKVKLTSIFFQTFFTFGKSRTSEFSEYGEPAKQAQMVRRHDAHGIASMPFSPPHVPPNRGTRGRTGFIGRSL